VNLHELMLSEPALLPHANWQSLESFAAPGKGRLGDEAAV
jgi:hypothetical protein